MAERIFDIQGFTGGEADDLYRGPKDSFFQAENVEIRKNLSGAKLASAMKDTGRTIDGNITCMVNLETLGVVSGGIVVCTDTGKVYLNGTLKTTLTSTGNLKVVVGIGVMTTSGDPGTQYVYYISKPVFTAYTDNTYIHRSATNLATASFIEGHKKFNSKITYDTAITINNNGILHFSAGNKIFTLDKVEVVTEKLLLPNDELITGFTQFQNNFKIYSKIANSGVQYVWNGTDLLPEYRQVWENQPILGVVNDGAYDYAVLGFNENYSDLYLISGTQKQELRVNLEANANSRVLDKYISIREGIVYISGGLSGQSTNRGVYTYGNYYPGTAKGLVQEYGFTTDYSFYGHCHSTVFSYVIQHGATTDKVYTIEHSNPPATNFYSSSGYIISPMYQGNLWEKKTFNKMEVGYSLETGSSIKIYLRTSFSGSWQLAKTITDTTQKGCKIFQNDIKALALGNFYEYQVKVELLPGTSSNNNVYTPTISRITTFLKTVE